MFCHSCDRRSSHMCICIQLRFVFPPNGIRWAGSRFMDAYKLTWSDASISPDTYWVCGGDRDGQLRSRQGLDVRTITMRCRRSTVYRKREPKWIQSRLCSYSTVFRGYCVRMTEIRRIYQRTGWIRRAHGVKAADALIRQCACYKTPAPTCIFLCYHYLSLKHFPDNSSYLHTYSII